MDAARPCFRLILNFALAFLLCSSAGAQEAGNTVVEQGPVKDDYYAAGGTVEISAEALGDVVVAGGRVTVEQVVKGDVMVAGGEVRVTANVADDVRAAGGEVVVDGPVGGDAIIAGASVTLGSKALVGGRAWLAGGTVRVDGKVGKGMKIMGDRIIISGEITGDVKLRGDYIEIQPTAVINGNVSYHSLQEAEIAEGAKISGSIARDTLYADERGDNGWFGGLFFALTLLVATGGFFLLFPLASVGAARRINESPLGALGLGLALLFVTPPVIVLLLVTVVGIWLAFALFALYLVMLLLGYLTGVIYVGDVGLKWLRKRKVSTTAWRLLSIAVGLVVLWAIGMIPVLGGLVSFAVLVFGLGALGVYLWRRYTAVPA